MKHRFPTQLLISLLLLVNFSWPMLAQTEDTEPEVPVSYTYRVPFPEANYFGIWHFRLELASLLGVDYKVSLVGYTAEGTVSFRREETSVAGTAQYRWDSVNKTITPIQSLTIVSDQELVGALWLWDGNSFNGVAITDKAGPQLLLPHVPSDIFNWDTQFAVTGYSEPNFTTDLFFGYYDHLGNYEEVLAWMGLHSRGYYRASPFLELPIGNLGEELDLSWARLRSTFDEFHLTGYQTLVRENFSANTEQSCAVEMVTEGASSGWVGFSDTDTTGFKNWFVFTNPSETEIIELKLFLNHRVANSEEEAAERSKRGDVLTTPISLLLSPKQSVKRQLAELFGSFEGVPVSLKYEATTVPVVVSEDDVVNTEPRPLLAMYVQENLEGTSMGGSNFVAQDGDLSTVWLDRNAPYTSLIELFSTHDRYMKLDLAITSGQGEFLLPISFEIAAYDSQKGITSQYLFDRVEQMLIARNQEAGIDEPVVVPAELRVDMSLESAGSFFTKITSYQPKDFAIINGRMIPPEPEPVADPDAVPSENPEDAP